MSDTDPNTAKTMSEQPAGSHVVPRFNVDAAEIYSQPFTVHVVMGANTPVGEATPCVHLTMSPAFAIYLRDALTEATVMYTNTDAAEPAPNLAEPPEPDVSPQE